MLILEQRFFPKSFHQPAAILHLEKATVLAQWLSLASLLSLFTFMTVHSLNLKTPVCGIIKKSSLLSTFLLRDMSEASCRPMLSYHTSLCPLQICAIISLSQPKKFVHGDASTVWHSYSWWLRNQWSDSADCASLRGDLRLWSWLEGTGLLQTAKSISLFLWVSLWGIINVLWMYYLYILPFIIPVT